MKHILFKKTLCILLSTVILLSIFGCGNSAEKNFNEACNLLGEYFETDPTVFHEEDIDELAIEIRGAAFDSPSDEIIDLYESVTPLLKKAVNHERASILLAAVTDGIKFAQAELAFSEGDFSTAEDLFRELNEKYGDDFYSYSSFTLDNYLDAISVLEPVCGTWAGDISEYNGYGEYDFDYTGDVTIEFGPPYYLSVRTPFSDCDWGAYGTLTIDATSRSSSMGNTSFHYSDSNGFYYSNESNEFSEFMYISKQDVANNHILPHMEYRGFYCDIQFLPDFSPEPLLLLVPRDFSGATYSFQSCGIELTKES